MLVLVGGLLFPGPGVPSFKVEELRDQGDVSIVILVSIYEQVLGDLLVRSQRGQLSPDERALLLNLSTNEAPPQGARPALRPFRLVDDGDGRLSVVPLPAVPTRRYLYEFAAHRGELLHSPRGLSEAGGILREIV